MATLLLAATARRPAGDGNAGGAPLLVDQEANVVPDGHDVDNAASAGGGGFSWPTFLGFAFLTYNSATAIVRSKDDPVAVAFVGLSYADLLALFACIRMFERAPAGSSKREWLKIAVWVLTTLLTLGFSYKVAAVMPPAVAVVIWLMAFATIAGGFVAFFVYKEKGEAI